MLSCTHSCKPRTSFLRTSSNSTTPQYYNIIAATRTRDKIRWRSRTLGWADPPMDSTLSLSDYLAKATSTMHAMTPDERETFYEQLVVKGFMVNGTESDGNCLPRRCEPRSLSTCACTRMRSLDLDLTSWVEWSGGNYGEYLQRIAGHPMLTAATRVYHCAIELLYVWSSRCEGAKVRRRCELLYFRFDCVTKFSIYYMSFIIYVINCYCVVKLMTEYLSNFICYYLKSDLKIYLATVWITTRITTRITTDFK